MEFLFFYISQLILNLLLNFIFTSIIFLILYIIYSTWIIFKCINASLLNNIFGSYLKKWFKTFEKKIFNWLCYRLLNNYDWVLNRNPKKKFERFKKIIDNFKTKKTKK